MSSIKLMTEEYAGSVFVTGPELNAKQDKLKAGENITISADNTISASGGSGGSSKRYYYDVVSTQPSSLGLIYTPTNPFFGLNLEINLNYKFPEEGEIHVTHIMLPMLKTTKDNLYIGFARDVSAYKGPAPKESFWLMTSQPLALPEGEASKTYYDVECDFLGGQKISQITSWPVGPGYEGWTGWLDSFKPRFDKKVAYYSKSVVDGVEMFTWVADYEIGTPVYGIPIEYAAQYEKWSNNPQFDKDSTSYSMTQMMVRASMYLNATIIFGIRYEFTPIGAKWPENHTCTSYVPPNE